MNFNIENIGKIKSANIHLSDLNIITGKNGTGKSTLVKTLFTILNTIDNIDNKVRQYKIDYLYRRITIVLNREMVFNEEMEEITNYVSLSSLRRDSNILQLISELIDHSISLDSFLSYLKQILFEDAEYHFEDLFKKIEDSVHTVMNLDSQEIFFEILRRNLSDEFHHNITSIPGNGIGYINLKTSDLDVNLKIDENTRKTFITGNYSKRIQYSKEIEYIADSNILDYVSYFRNAVKNKDHHSFKLIRDLQKEIDNPIEQMILDQQLEELFDDITISNNKPIKFTKNNGLVVELSDGQELNVQNLCAGEKIGLILQKLLYNGVLENLDYLILDEPENHLHPEWQIKLARLLVSIQKKYDITLIVTTHSPYFTIALDNYSNLYSIDTKYYLAKENNENLIFKDVTQNKEEVYRELQQPLQDLENLLYDEGI